MKLLTLLPFASLALASAIATSCTSADNSCPNGFECDVSSCSAASLSTKLCKGRCVPTEPIPTPTPTSDPQCPGQPEEPEEPEKPEEPEEPEEPEGNQYPSCGGFRIQPLECENPDAVCIDDPRVEGCGMACDGPGICVVPQFCGGIAAFECPEGLECWEDPRDDCDPHNGGADCGGICI